MKQILKYLLFLIIGIIFYILLNNIDHFNIGVPPRDTLQYYCITEGFPFYLGSTNEEIRIVRGTDGAAGAAGQPEHTGGAAGPSTVQVDNPLYDAGAGECDTQELEPEPEPEPESPPPTCTRTRRVRFNEEVDLVTYYPTTLNQLMPITDTTNPETTLHFRPMVADGNTINYRFYPSIVRTGHIGNIRVLIGPRNDPFATFTEFIEYLLRFRFICMNDRREINITDNNTIVYLFRFLNQFVNTFNLETLGFTDTILQNIYRFLYPNLRNYTNQIRAHRYQFAILNQIYTETFDRDSDNVDRQINNILKLMYFIINGFDHIVIVDRVIQENTNENTYENINIGQLFLMHNYRTGQAFILFHVATDGNVYGNLTIPGNEALQTRLREAVGTDPFTLNNIHAGIIGGGRLGMLYQRCAAMRF